MTSDDIKALQERIREKAKKRPSSILGEAFDPPPTKAKGNTKPRERSMNKTEAEYATYLQGEKEAGRIVAFWFEAWKIRIADNCTWLPDFVVIDCDGYVEWQDTKAWWKKANKLGITDDAVVKMKAVAELYPQIKVVATWKQDGVKINTVN